MALFMAFLILPRAGALAGFWRAFEPHFLTRP